jgi:hypothetical protein
VPLVVTGKFLKRGALERMIYDECKSDEIGLSH